ncbi:anti-sigma factor [Flectobacillus longus]|uniref:anti-sigma factor n=1 Tax=Flectobacillus longus TaxID=2984207 RepID=UPI0024B643CD|nr:anti-sigma factor [Flectobacillus longus]MDI9878237.1 anti-sigma factor [Flectobacillus longus]
MNIQEYIASGVLESYVLGSTTADETAEVERLAQTYPIIQLEIDAVRDSIEEYALKFAKTPPPELKSRVMNALSELEEAEKANTKAVAPEAKVVNFTPESNNSAFSFKYAASWVLLVLSVAANWFLYSNWKKSEDKVVALESQTQILASSERALKASYQENINILLSPETKRVQLGGQKPAPDAQAVVYWNSATQEVYLSSVKLPVAPEGKQYQLWAIVDGKPVDAGLLDDPETFEKMKSLGNAQAFAISLEAKGGSTTESGPKGEIFVLGNV